MLLKAKDCAEGRTDIRFGSWNDTEIGYMANFDLKETSHIKPIRWSVNCDFTMS